MVRILHFMKGDLEEEYVIFTEGDDPASDWCNPGFEFKEETKVEDGIIPSSFPMECELRKVN